MGYCLAVQIGRSRVSNCLYDPKVSWSGACASIVRSLPGCLPPRRHGACAAQRPRTRLLHRLAFNVLQRRSKSPSHKRLLPYRTGLPSSSDLMVPIRCCGWSSLLKPPHLQEEEQFLNQLQDRNSPLFHKYLTEGEWNPRFAPSVQDEQAVAAWAQSQGLTITQRFPNRLLVDVEAPVAIIEKALMSPSTATRWEAPHTIPTIATLRFPAVVGVVHAVLGFNNIEVAHSFSKAPDFIGPDYSPGPAYAGARTWQGTRQEV